MSKPIDLTYIKNQIANSAVQIQKIVDKDGKPVNLIVKKLLGKIPELKNFPEETKIFQIGKYNGEFYGKTLALYKSDDGKPMVYSPDYEMIENCKIVSYTAGIGGSAKIKMGKEEFIIDFPISNYHLENLNDIMLANGEGLPPIELCKQLPHKTTSWENLDMNQTYTIIGETTPDNEHYNTNRWIIADNEDNQFEVYENHSLRQLITNNGLDIPFKIAKVKKSKDGKKYVTLTVIGYEDLTV